MKLNLRPILLLSDILVRLSHHLLRLSTWNDEASRTTIDCWVARQRLHHTRLILTAFHVGTTDDEALRETCWHWCLLVVPVLSPLDLGHSKLLSELPTSSARVALLTLWSLLELGSCSIDRNLVLRNHESTVCRGPSRLARHSPYGNFVLRLLHVDVLLG